MRFRIYAFFSVLCITLLVACSTMKSPSQRLASSSQAKSLSAQPGYKFATFCDEYIVEIPEKLEAGEGSQLIVAGPTDADGNVATLEIALSSTPSDKYKDIDSCTKYLSQGMQNPQISPAQTVMINGMAFDKVSITGSAPPKDNGVAKPYSAGILWGKKPPDGAGASVVVITWGPDESCNAGIWEKIATTFRKK